MLSPTDFFLWPQHNLLYYCYVTYVSVGQILLGLHFILYIYFYEASLMPLSMQILLVHSGSLLVLLQIFIYVKLFTS